MAFTMSPILSMTAAFLFASIIPKQAIHSPTGLCIVSTYITFAIKNPEAFASGIFYGVDNGLDSKGR